MTSRSQPNRAFVFPGTPPQPLARTGAVTAPEMQKADMIDGLRKGLEVICAFDDGTPRLTQSELALRLSLSRAAARRYLMTLTALGYMATDGRAFWLTPKVMRLGHSYVASARLPRTVFPALQKLTEACGESSNLAVLEGAETVYISRVNAAKLLSTGIEPGTRLPTHTSTAGRLLLSHLPAAALDEWLAGATLKRYTPLTVVDKSKLRQQIVRMRKQGWGITESQFEIGLRGIAVPLYDSAGDVVGALSVSMSIASLGAAASVKRFVPLLKAAAETLRSQL